jgi:hypothetical protein
MLWKKKNQRESHPNKAYITELHVFQELGELMFVKHILPELHYTRNFMKFASFDPPNHPIRRLTYHSILKDYLETGDVAQWQCYILVYTRSWDQFPVLQKNKN